MSRVQTTPLNFHYGIVMRAFHRFYAFHQFFFLLRGTTNDVQDFVLFFFLFYVLLSVYIFEYVGTLYCEHRCTKFFCAIFVALYCKYGCARLHLFVLYTFGQYIPCIYKNKYFVTDYFRKTTMDSMYSCFVFLSSIL